MNMEKIKSFVLNSNNKLKIIVALGLVGMLLIAGTSIFPAEKKEKAKSIETQDWNEYKKQLEDELKNVISSIDGVGNCEIMITLCDTNENVYAQNSTEKTDEKKTEYENDYVIYDGENGDNPILIKQYFPEVKGVAVVCDGGDDIHTKEKIVNSVTALFNISANRISVSKIKNN